MRVLQGQSERVVGLDIVRCLAIGLVLLGHSSEHSQPPRVFVYIFGRLGSIGVELFFALSGFLIGSIIVKQLGEGSFDRFAGLRDFWFRRWMRTLPLYYFFLFVWLRLDWRGPFSISSQLEYFVFGQNLTSPTPAFFEVSWSLAVEEWFYLLFPLVVFLLNTAMKAKPAFWGATASFLIFPLVLRYWSAAHLPPGQNLFAALRIPVVLRLDAIMYGVIVATFRQWNPRAWAWMIRIFPGAMLAFISLMVFFVSILPLIKITPIGVATLLTLSPIVCAGILPGFSQIKTLSLPVAQSFFIKASILSYSMYLGHVIVIILINPFLMRHNLYDTYYVTYPAYFMLYYLFSIVTYSFVERPFLWIRDARGARYSVVHNHID